VARTNAKYAELFPFDVSLFDGVGSRAITLSCQITINGICRTCRVQARC